MSNKQESLSDYYTMAKEIAKVEKEFNIEHWVYITIDRNGDKEGEYINLYHYDLPRHIAEKYDWVIRWRTAMLQCKYPRYSVCCRHSPYRKVMGANIGMQKDLYTFIAAKAQLTKQQRDVDSYIQHEKKSNMFFNEDTDEQLIKAKEKLVRKREAVIQAEARLIEKVKQVKQSQYYTLK